MTTSTLLARPVEARRYKPGWLLLAALPICIALLLLAILGSIALGAAEIDAGTVWQSVVAYDSTNTAHLIIHTLRLPRALTAVMVGAALGVAGALMQGLTRNPLADPGLLGIEAGAALGVVSAVYFLHISSLVAYALFAFGGGAITAVVVYALGSTGRGGATPFKLTIAGAALSALLSSLTTALLMFNQRALEEVRFWLAGSVAGLDMTVITQAAPYIIAGLVVALLLGRQITTLSLGEDIAKGLGQNVGLVRAVSAAVVVLLAGASVALAGPIGFVGLVIPNAVRMFVGVDYRWIIPYSAVTGAIFLVVADIAGRLVLRPLELPVGVMTAAIGGPIFIYLVRWKVGRGMAKAS